MKKIFLFLCAVLLIGQFVSAGGGEQQAAGGIRTITVLVPSMGPVPAGRPEVEAAINKIMEPHGVRVNYTIIEVGSWSNMVPVMMASQEKIDLQLTVPMPATSFPTLVSQNQLMDITDLVNKNGAELTKTVQNVLPAFFEGTKVNGRLYGVAGLYSKANYYYWLARADLLDKYKIDITAVKSLDDIEAAMKKVKDGEPSISPLAAQIDGLVMELSKPDRPFSEQVDYTSFQDNLSYAYMDNPYRVVNHFATDHFKKNVEKMRDWYLKGYVYKDAAINKEMPEELVKSNKAFSWFMDSETGVEAAKSAQTGHTVRAVVVNPREITTDLMRKFVWAVPVYSKEGEAAVKFLNQLYSDPRLSRLITWGVEGRDYVVKPDGTAAYPQGLTAQTVPFHQMDFLGGNQFLVPPWEGNVPDLREQVLKQNQAAKASVLLGFSYDPTPVQLEISSVSNAISQYAPGLRSGSVDPNVYLPQFLKALDDAGAPKLVQEAQKQLDAWRKAVGK